MRNLIKFALMVAVSFCVTASTPPKQPKLIVAFVVDQMRYDYLERFGEHFTTNGLRTFTDHGVFMTFGHYDYAPTVTGPGHASYLSGSTPMMHGIIGNDWYDKKTGRDINCVEDQSVEGVGATPGKGRASPRNFIGSTFADELRLRYKSKVVGISIKDRGAILPSGKKPTGAYWFFGRNGNFITSTYYMDQLPEWVQEFNKRRLPAEYQGKTWERLLDEKYYIHPDNVDWEDNLADEKRPAFPHKVAKSSSFDAVVPTPYGQQLLIEFAKAAIEGENLGQSGHPDLLTVSFSTLDSIGHKFGPYSHEVQDAFLRLDRQLAEFFTYLDQKFGMENVMMTFTADHGVAPVPEFAKSMGLDGARLSESEFLNDLKEHLAEEFGPGKYFISTKLFSGNLFLNHAVLEKKNLKMDEVAKSVRDFALASGKFQAVYSRDQILDGRATGPIGKLVTNGYNAERGGDLVLIAKPYLVPGSGKGVTHGTPYAYDTHIPILFYGKAFNPGRYADPFGIIDIVPTLCAALGLNEPPLSMGKPLPKILADQGK